MKKSIVEDKLLPEDEDDFKLMKIAGKCKFTNCRTCKKEFSSENTHSSAGWRETQITGDCEDCFDAQWKE